MKKKIGIYGIAGVYNLGCEAIVRGTYENLKNEFENAEWIYFSPNKKKDAIALTDLPIEIRETKKKWVFIKKCFNKMFDILNIGYQIPYDNYKEIIKSVDTIISVGGDIYTIPAYLRNKKKYPYYNRLVDFGNLALKMNKKIIIYGASIGPFGDYSKAVLYYKSHLQKVNLIVARDKFTIKYLADIGISNNVVFLPDPAFALRKNEKMINNQSKIIGINLSGLSLMETYGKITKDTITSLAKVIERIIDCTGYDILFIPHVFAPYEIDNDFIIENKIIDSMDESYKNRVTITEKNTFLTIKDELIQCSIVIAARMHCAINAMSEGIPTILLSYSSKAKGMCEFVYGDTKWVYDIKKLDNEQLLFLINELLENRNAVSQNIVKNLNKKLQKVEYDRAYKILSKIVNN
ncbi:MAG: hypothetical protein EGQ23_02935 [Solobacterium sp.]|nr:hypothetical protein [Solobacterium sp.]